MQPMPTRQMQFTESFRSAMDHVNRQLYMRGPKGSVGGYPLDAPRSRRRQLARQMAREAVRAQRRPAA
jgi:hypothetical protein